MLRMSLTYAVFAPFTPVSFLGFGRRTECLRDAGRVIVRRPSGKQTYLTPSGEGEWPLANETARQNVGLKIFWSVV